MRHERSTFVVACAFAAMFSAHALPQASPKIVKVAPVAATDPPVHPADKVDDPAIWLHPTDPERSLMLGTNKKEGVEVYSVDGRRRTIVGAGLGPNKIDVRYGIEVAGKTRDIAVAGVRGTGVGLAAWWIDPADGTLTSAGPVLPVFGGKEPYGCCLYRCARDGTLYVFATSKTGDVEQLLLTPNPDGK